MLLTVDSNSATGPDLIENAETLDGIADSTFDRWRCDPPYNLQTAKSMYGNSSVPNIMKLLKAGARVCPAKIVIIFTTRSKELSDVPKRS